MKKRMLCCLLALVLAVGLLSACGSGKAAVYVQSVAALTGYGSLGGANASSGVVVAQKEIKVERDSSRKIKQLNVEVGQEVKSGEVLFTYDMEDMQLTIDKAKLEIEQMKNNVKDLTTQISQLEKEKKSAPTSEQLSYTVQIQALEADKKEAEYNITVKQKELDAAAEDWVNYLTSEDENEAPPCYSIEIKGKLEKQVKDDDYKQYYSEAQDDLSYVSVEKDEYAELMITNGEVKATFTYVFFSLGLILGIGGIALGILSAVSDSKKKKLEEQSAMTNDETFNG